MSQTSLWIAAGRTIGYATVASAAIIFLLRLPLTKRVRPAYDVKPTDTSDSTGLRSHHRIGGRRERWHLSQPKNMKRCFAEAITITGKMPTKFQLHCALSKIALDHPMLIAFPTPACDGYASQITESSLNAEGRIPFPLAVLKDSIVTLTTGEKTLDQILEEMINQPSEVDPTEEEFVLRHSNGIKWSGIKLVLLPGEPSKNTQNQHFTLAMRMAHCLGDGMSGIVFFRHLLTALAEVQRSQDSHILQEQPSSIDVSELKSIASYPSTDDLLDFRPRVIDVVRNFWQDRIISLFHSKPKPSTNNDWWRGESLVANPTDTKMKLEPCGYRPIHIPVSKYIALQAESKKHSLTLHTLLHTAAAFATGIVAIKTSGKESITVHAMNPWHVRNLFGSCSPAADDLIGNHVARVESRTVHSIADDDTSNKKRDIWDEATTYSTTLQASKSTSLAKQMSILLQNSSAHELALEKSWRGRGQSFVVSNLGSLDRFPDSPLNATFQTQTGFTLDSVSFVQASHYSGSVFSCNAIQCQRDGIRIGFSFPTNIVKHEHADLFICAFHRVIDSVVEDGTCTFAEVAKEFIHSK